MSVSGVIGISTAETGRYSVFYASLSGLQRPENTITVFARSAVISENRNAITQTAIDNEAEWVLFLDDDHILRSDTLMRLLDSGKDVISAHYVRRQEPFNSVLLDNPREDLFLWKDVAPADKGIISVDAAGAGCLLVRKNVLHALKPPYWTLGQVNPASWGDDLDFCRRIRQAGFEVYCDLDSHIGHLMMGCVWPENVEGHGWVAKFASDPGKKPITYFPMPLPGDLLGS